MPPTNWPTRPAGFYYNWQVFCVEVLTSSLKSEQEGNWLAVVLLAGGGALGATSLMKLVETNSKLVDRKGKEWGIDSLSQLAKGGSVLLGAALGGAGGMWLMRVLSRHARQDKVNELSQRLRLARREYDELLQDMQAELTTDEQHRGAVEYLFWRFIK